jgi:hypothetical protein
MAVLISWIGLGWGLHQFLRLNRRLRSEWSILAASGMSVILACGGIANALHVTSAGLLNLFTAGGMILSCGPLIRRSRIQTVSARGDRLWILPLIIVGAILFLFAIIAPHLNPGDDQLAYLVFPKQMLQTGTLLAPFNLRRMGTYGGQQLLQAQILAAAQALAGPKAASFFAAHGNLLDSGISPIIGAGLLWRLVHPRSSLQRAFATLLVLAFLVMPVERVNTHAQVTGTVLFLALFVVLATRKQSHHSLARLSILAGTIAAAFATLRMNFVPAAGLALILSSIPFQDLRSLRHGRGWITFTLPLVVMALLLIPWAIVLQQSSGTPLYPLLKGFQHGAFLDAPITAHTIDHLSWTLKTGLFPPIFFLLLPLGILPTLRSLRGIMPLYAAALLTTLATAWAYTQVDTATLYRYSAPLLIACAFAALARLFHAWPALSNRTRIATVGLILLIPFVAAHEYSEAFRAAYPVLLGPVLLLAVWSARRLRPSLALFISGALLLLVIVGAVRNFHRIADNNGLFYYAVAIVGLAWSAGSSHRLIARRLFGAATVLLACTGIVAVIHVIGAAITLSTLAIVLTAALLGWRVRCRNSPHVIAALAVLALAALALSVIHLPFLYDCFAPICLIASVCALAFIGGRTPAPTLRLASVIAVILLACSAMPSMSSLAFYPNALPFAWLTIAVLWLIAQTSRRLPLAVVAILLLVGHVPLAIAEIATGAADYRARLPVADFLMHDLRKNQIYEEAQRSIPAGATVFVLVPEPARLDFARNRIDQSDYELEFISPPPMLPIRGNAADLERYWNILGIRYLLLSQPGMEAKGALLPAQFKQALIGLSRTHRILFNESPLTVVDLQN